METALLEPVYSWTAPCHSCDALGMGRQREEADSRDQKSCCLRLQILHHQSDDRAGNAPEHSLVMMQGERLKRCVRESIIPTANGKLDNSFQMGGCRAQRRTGGDTEIQSLAFPVTSFECICDPGNPVMVFH